MSFVYPEFLYALTALAIPIIIHLFNFRRYKKVYFSNVRFLKEVNEQTRSRSRLKHILVLIARLLAIAFLVFAFTQPFIPGSASDAARGDRIISVYIDNSFSMEVEGSGGMLLETGKRKAIEIASQYNATDRFQLVTNDLEGHQQRLLSREEFIETVQDVKLSPASRLLSEIMLRQLDLVNTEPDVTRRLVWISDFQKSTSDLNALAGRTSPRVVLVPLKAQRRSNLFIDTVWFESPVRQLNTSEKLMVRIRNSGDIPVENVSLRLSVNGTQKAISSFAVDAGSFCDSALTYTNTGVGVQLAKVSIGDAQVAFDDDWFFSYSVEERVNILSLTGDNPADTSAAVSRLFRNDPFFKLESRKVSQVDFSSFPSRHLIILNEVPVLSSGLTDEVVRFVNAGGNVLLFPSIRSELSSLNNFLVQCGAAGFTGKDTSAIRPAPIDVRTPFFSRMFEREPREIDLPQFRFRYISETRSMPGKEQLWKMRNGDEFLSRYSKGKGFIYVSTVPLSEKAGNFSKHALFVPVVLRIAEWSQGSGINMQLIGRDLPIEIRSTLPGGDATFQLENEVGDFSVIPEMRNTGGGVSLYVHGQIREAGNYKVKKGNDLIAGIGFNYDRKESDLACYETEEISKILESGGMSDFTLFDKVEEGKGITLEALDDTREYWRLCILLALLFLLAEVLLIRLMKQ